MSIRLRLTLLYSAILASTLAVFGIALYSLQSQYTLNALKQDLSTSAEKINQSLVHIPPMDPKDQGNGTVPFREFSDDIIFLRLPEREITRILDPDGNLIASPNGMSEEALPLSKDGLAAVQEKKGWLEQGTVDDIDLLIFSYPVVVNDQVIFIVQVARPLTERNNSLNSLATTLTFAGIITTLAAFGIGWVLSGYTLRPIHRITQTAQEIGRERDFDRRVEYRGPPDEVGQLATTFNNMLARLQDAYQQVAKSLEMQRNFVADVSHELRTPLTTLRGNLGLLQRNPPLPKIEQQDILKDMESESDRLIRLVNELLVLARADAGRSFTRESISLLPLVEEVCKQTRLLDPERAITTDVDPSFSVLGDRDALKQVLLVLLDNAMKYSDGTIAVQAEKVGKLINIIIQDEGQGIPPEVLEHVFDRFYRADETGEQKGFGLGLAIAKALAEKQDGTLALESEVGKGSKAIVSLPLAEEENTSEV
jgi:signal transduction histidine kinase